MTNRILTYEQAIRAAGSTCGQGLMRGYQQVVGLMDQIREGLKPDITQLKYVDRMALVKEYSFAIPSVRALETLRPYAPLVEIGAGTGYWSWELTQAGIEVIATEPYAPGHKDQYYQFNKTWLPLESLTGLEALDKYPNHTPLLIWPSYDEGWATEILKAYRGRFFIYVGEWGGCCADDEFFEVLEHNYKEVANVVIPQWEGIHDELWVFKREAGTTS